MFDFNQPPKKENHAVKKITEEDLNELLRPIPPQIQQSALFQAALSYLAHNAGSLKEIMGSMSGMIKIEELARTLKESPLDGTTKMLIGYNLAELQQNPVMMGHVDQYLTATADFYIQD